LVAVAIVSRTADHGIYEDIMSRVSSIEQGQGSPEQVAAYNDEIARVGQVTNMKKGHHEQG